MHGLHAPGRGCCHPLADAAPGRNLHAHGGTLPGQPEGTGAQRAFVRAHLGRGCHPPRCRSGRHSLAAGATSGCTGSGRRAHPTASPPIRGAAARRHPHYGRVSITRPATELGGDRTALDCVALSRDPMRRTEGEHHHRKRQSAVGGAEGAAMNQAPEQTSLLTRGTAEALGTVQLPRAPLSRGFVNRSIMPQVWLRRARVLQPSTIYTPTCQRLRLSWQISRASTPTSSWSAETESLVRCLPR